MSISIEHILKAEGPCLSKRLGELLEQRGVSPGAARQRIARAGGSVRRLKGLTFPRGVRFMYHEATFGSHDYWNALLRDIQVASPAYAPAIAALRTRGGIVPRPHFDIISGSPVRQKGQIASATVLERLTSVRLVEQVELESIGPCVALDAGGHFDRCSVDQLKARLLTEKILLLAVKDWARKLGAASYGKVALRDDPGGPPKVGTCLWDFAAPSYLRPMIRRAVDGTPMPGFLICDALAGHRLDELAVTAFVRKCRLLAGLRNLAPVMPLLIADGFSPEAFRLGRSQGIMMATPTTLFGHDVAMGLAALLGTLTRAAAVAVKRPEIINELFDRLGQIEGAAANLRGALFEMIVGYCVVKNDDGQIDIGKRVVDPVTGERAEIDVFRVKEYREVWVYECKGHQPAEVVDHPTVERWLSDRVPRIHRVMSREARFQGCTFHYDYWTCGSFSPDALAFLKARREQTKKYAIGWKDGSAVRAYASRVRPKSVLEALDQHFFNHPIARANKRYNANAAIEEINSELSLDALLEAAEDLTDLDLYDLEEEATAAQ